MSGAITGNQTATVSFGNSDANENPYDFTVTGTVRPTKIIDDGDPGFSMWPLPSELGGWGQAGGPGREFDYKYNRNYGIDAFVTWTFNVTPGVYRVSTTWPFGFSGYDNAAPFTIFDGTVADGVVVGGRNVNQQIDPDDTDYPAGFMFPAGTSGSTMWERIDEVIINGTMLTVRLQAIDAVEFVLADSVLIDRLADVPAAPVDYGVTQLQEGNSAGDANVVRVSPRPADRRLGETPATDENNGRPEAYPTGPVYWSDDLDEAAVVLAKEQATGVSDELSSELAAAGQMTEAEAIDCVLSDWL
ncbi:MAG: hypothetical protein HY000_39940 [Planctomycetes bacterium]|nr:hypothetical protein [Planctomycetota bacterium]